MNDLRKIRLRDKDSLALLLFILNVFLVFAVFLPNLSELNPWDEAAFFHNGRELLDEGSLPSFAGNPIVSLFFALSYAPFQGSIHWMPLSVTLARILLFSMLWLSTYLVAREFEGFTSPLLPLGFLFVTPLTVEFLRFPSDPLFASFAGLSLWQFLKYKRTGLHKHLILASIFMGLSALSRNDGVILFIILFLLTMILSFGDRLWKAIAAVLIPFLGITGGYLLLYSASTGNVELGIAERTYTNFESGQQVIYAGSDKLNPVVEARLQARRIFGTPKENNNSVFRAISNNPSVYGERLLAVTGQLPTLLLRAYGIRFSAVVFLFALRGLIELIREKEYLLSLILVLWPSHLVTGFVITLFRVGHLQFPFYIVFLLSAIGLHTSLRNLEDRNEQRTIGAVLIALSIYALVDNKLAIFYGSALTLTGLLIILIFHKRGEMSKLTMLLILLFAGVIIRGEYPSPKLREFGLDPKEKSLEFIVDHYEQGTLMGAGSPGVVWAAKMRYAGLTAADVPIDRSPEEFLDWMVRQGIRVIYVDQDLYVNSPELWGLIEPLIGDGLARVFVIEGGNYQVLEISNGS